MSVLRGHSVFSSPTQRPMTSDFEGFSIPDAIHYIYFPILIREKEPVFPFLMFSAKLGNYWYHCLTSLVWRGLLLGIEPGTSHTRCQHSTTRLSRRLCSRLICMAFFDYTVPNYSRVNTFKVRMWNVFMQWTLSQPKALPCISCCTFVCVIVILYSCLTYLIWL